MIALNEQVASIIEARFAAAGPYGARLRERFMGWGLIGVLVSDPGDPCSQQCLWIYAEAGKGVREDHRHRDFDAVDDDEAVLRYVVGLPEGTPMAHLRQLIIVSEEESLEIAQAMGVGDGLPLKEGLQLENIVVSRFPDLSRLPGGTDLTFMSAGGEQRTATLRVVGPNEPYGNPHANIVAKYRREPRVAYYDAAAGRRGVNAVIRTSGRISSGDIMLVWQHA